VQWRAQARSGDYRGADLTTTILMVAFASLVVAAIDGGFQGNYGMTAYAAAITGWMALSTELSRNPQ
jgi:hypothetical protein